MNGQRAAKAVVAVGRGPAWFVVVPIVDARGWRWSATKLRVAIVLLIAISLGRT
jgi:hypothetical protein